MAAQVLQLLMENSHLEHGLSIADVAARFANQPADTVREVMANLVNEGHLYSTIDEEHFKHTG